MFLTKDVYVPDQFGERRIPFEFDAPQYILYNNVQAAITNWNDGDFIQYGKQFYLKGYAFSGKGSKIVRVEISTDGARWDPA